MRLLPTMNAYQQLLYMALALVEEKDLVEMFRAMRNHPERNVFVDLVNAELDRDLTLWQAFEGPGPLHSAMENAWPVFQVLVHHGNSIHLDVGLNDDEGHMIAITAKIDPEGRAYEVDCYRYWPGGRAPGGFTEPLSWRVN